MCHLCTIRGGFYRVTDQWILSCSCLVYLHSIGATHLALPETYKGYLRLTSTNGHLELGDSLKKNSKALPGDSSKDIIYYISPSSSSSAMFSEDEKMDLTELDDNCHCSSVSGQIRAVYYGNMDDAELESFAWSRRQSRDCCVVA